MIILILCVLNVNLNVCVHLTEVLTAGTDHL